MKALFICLALVGIIQDSSASSRSEREIYTMLADTSVRVRIDTPSKKGRGSGTVVALTKHGALVLTCAHVIGKESGVLIDRVDSEGNVHTFAGLVEKVDTQNDLALIHVLGDTGLKPVRLAIVVPELYTPLYSVGAPLGLQGVPVHYTLADKLMPEHYWMLGGTTMPGQSGSGVETENGDLVCVVAACPMLKDAVITDIGFCIPLPIVRQFLVGYAL